MNMKKLIATDLDMRYSTEGTAGIQLQIPADQSVLTNAINRQTHTHTHTWIYTHMCVCVCVYMNCSNDVQMNHHHSHTYIPTFHQQTNRQTNTCSYYKFTGKTHSTS